ncbi:MAG: hypothetical protein LC647_05855, partial [Beggiatoa sp.]|nr:hypothetical protein [Beggiatoa sp.]
MVEEEYRHETIPHLYGPDRRAVLERKLAWFFRGTPYTHVLPEGRETEGRRDDKVLLSAITNPELVQPWIRLCVQQKVPIAGIYSLAIVSTALLDRINVKSPNVLWVSMQTHSGLRQSYFREGLIKISRLAKMPRLGTAPFAPYILAELDKFERYLKNVQLLAEGPLDIYILAHGELLDQLERQCGNSETVRYHLLDVADVARRLGIQGVLATPFNDYIYAHLLLKKRPGNHYAQGRGSQVLPVAPGALGDAPRERGDPPPRCRRRRTQSGRGVEAPAKRDQCRATGPQLPGPIQCGEGAAPGDPGRAEGHQNRRGHRGHPVPAQGDAPSDDACGESRPGTLSGTALLHKSAAGRIPP